MKIEFNSEIDFTKDSIIVVGSEEDRVNCMRKIYSELFTSDKIVYFFEKNFYDLEIYPSNAMLGEVTKLHNGIIGGANTILKDVTVAGRKNVTLMIHFDKEDLESSGCLAMISELVSNKEKYDTCNLILSTDSLDGLNPHFV